MTLSLCNCNSLCAYLPSDPVPLWGGSARSSPLYHIVVVTCCNCFFVSYMALVFLHRFCGEPHPTSLKKRNNNLLPILLQRFVNLELRLIESHQDWRPCASPMRRTHVAHLFAVVTRCILTPIVATARLARGVGLQRAPNTPGWSPFASYIWTFSVHYYESNSQ